MDILGFIRFGNLLIIAAALWVFRWALIGPRLMNAGIDFHLSQTQFHLLIADVLIVAIIGYWINDFRDRSVDAINRPKRLLVKYEIRPPAFWAMCIPLVVLGMALTFYLAEETNHLEHLWIYPASIVALFSYAFWLNRQGWIGNIVVSLMIAFLPWLLVLAELPAIIRLDEQVIRQLYQLLAIYAALMFFSTMAREICKDAEDAKGDQSVQSKSIPILFGFSTANLFIGAFLLGTILVEGLFLWVNISNFTAIISAVVVIATTLVALILTMRSRHEPDYRKLNSWLKFLMLVGIAQILCANS